MWTEEKQYFDQNILDMSIDITYIDLDILQVVISRLTYYISFERMCLTVYSTQSGSSLQSKEPVYWYPERKVMIINIHLHYSLIQDCKPL